MMMPMFRIGLDNPHNSDEKAANSPKVIRPFMTKIPPASIRITLKPWAKVSRYGK
ncbi:hypothetical protein D3C80_1666380 [compost metagenome]